MTNHYKGKGYVEFLANLEEIKSLAGKGYSITLIFNKLKNDKRITIKYGQFYKLFKKHSVDIRKVNAEKLGVNGKEIEKEKKKPLKRQVSQQSRKLTFENNPSQHNRHF